MERSINPLSISAVHMAPSKAIVVLGGGSPSQDERKVAKMLDFWGVPYRFISLPQICQSTATLGEVGSGTFCIVIAASVMEESFCGDEEGSSCLDFLIANAKSVLVYGFQDTDSATHLLKEITGLEGSTIRAAQSAPAIVTVTDTFMEMCGPMSGLHVSIVPARTDTVFSFPTKNQRIRSIVSNPEGDLFFSIDYKGVPFFVVACGSVIDIDAAADKFFDVKKLFCGAVPIAMYIKWAFTEICWKGVETRACLIVDDPRLIPQYGFLDFRRTLEAMDEHNFTMSLAFIPWNCRRTKAETVSLFRSRGDRLSISIHGCDHIAGEFASRSSDELNTRVKVASERMMSLEVQSLLKHERVMVFPRGEFSPETGRVLKLNGFIAAVNTEVTPAQASENKTTIADLWDIANTKYGSFPIFTRRYSTHGIENCAFDMFLGKPCLIVAHHEGFKDEGKDLIKFIDKINALPWKVQWCSLGEVISHSYRVRRQSGRNLLQMYGNSLSDENRTPKVQEIEVVKKESDPESLYAVTVNQQPVSYSVKNGYLRFAASIPPGNVEVRIVYSDNLRKGSYPTGWKYRMRISARRHLSELRDNYIAKSDLLAGCVSRLKQFVR